MRSLISKFYLTISVFGILFSQAGLVFAASAGDLYFLAQKSYYHLKASPEKQKFRHHWMKTIKMFSKVVEHYPKSNEAYKAEFTTGKLYEGLSAVSGNSKDLDKAAYHYQRVVANFPSSNLSDDALFQVAEIYLANGNLASASEAFKKIATKYPKGDQAQIAQQKYKGIKITDGNKGSAKKIVTSNIPEPWKPIISAKRNLQNKKSKSVVSIHSLKDPREIIASNADLKLKRAASGSDADKEKIVAEFKGETQKGEFRKKAVKKIIKPVLVKPVRQALKKVVKPTVSVRNTPKRVYVKDGFGGGYLYRPKASGGKPIKPPLIVVDAGHGGKDHGAIGASGIREKDVNLKIAKHVKTILVNRYKYRVVMTRKDDTFIPLKDRSKISNKRKADLFVSIHANAAKRKSAHGIETYFLGASHNEQALATAARENGELVKSVKDDQVQQILASLISTTKINDSSRLAGRVQENLYRSSKKANRSLKNLGVKEGPFYVLHGADMPSILVEVGFLTNRREAKMLAKPEYLYRLASSIAEGIHKYFLDKGPSI